MNPDFETPLRDYYVLQHTLVRVIMLVCVMTENDQYLLVFLISKGNSQNFTVAI